MKKSIIIFALSLFLIVVLTIRNFSFSPKDNKVELIEVEKLVYIEVGAIATPEELTRAYESINKGIFSHQYYITNSTSQTLETGDTRHNLEWVERYRLIKDLLDRAYPEIEK